MSANDWDQLAELAQAATPGPWTTYAAYGSRGVEVAETEDMLFIQDGGITYAVNEADAEFIAAANPATILNLLDELRRLWKHGKDAANFWKAKHDRVEALLDEWTTGGNATNPFPERVSLDVDTEVIAPIRAALWTSHALDGSGS